MRKGLAERLAQAMLTVVLDGETVIKSQPVGKFMGSLSGPAPKRSLFVFPGSSCLFIAHKMLGDKQPDGPPVGYFLPRGTHIRATVKGAPPIPSGVEVRIGGIGAHYSPDVNQTPKDCLAGECRS